MALAFRDESAVGDLQLKAGTVSVFRTALDLDPMSALEVDVTAVLGVEVPPLSVPVEVLDGVRRVHLSFLKSMSEDQAFITTMASLDLLIQHNDIATISAPVW
ncbi:hypothetical protein CVV67_01860 [Arthrobacter stackebrandtii]|nr:hypothetical protein CVV67_01860 [Arthrobacter stackebrandtii]